MPFLLPGVYNLPKAPTLLLASFPCAYNILSLYLPLIIVQKLLLRCIIASLTLCYLTATFDIVFLGVYTTPLGCGLGFIFTYAKQVTVRFWSGMVIFKMTPFISPVRLLNWVGTFCYDRAIRSLAIAIASLQLKQFPGSADLMFMPISV